MAFFDINFGMGGKVRLTLDPRFLKMERMFGMGGLKELRDALEVGTFRAAVVLKKEWERLYKHDNVAGHAALHPFTIAMKGHGKILFESGELSESLTVETVPHGQDELEFRVEVQGSNAKMKALIQESGTIIPVTQRMRNFLAARGFQLRRSTRFLRIPPRPVREEAVRNSRDDMIAAVKRRVAKTTIGRRMMA